MYYKFSIIGIAFVSLFILACLVYALFAIPAPHRQLVEREVTATTTAELLIKNAEKVMNATEPNVDAVIATWYAPLIPLTLGGALLQASVADTETERERGLSDTPYLPTGIVKLFIFEQSQILSFWMKDMNYSIDMIWLDESKTVVYIAADASPESYPTTFSPNIPARYVIETTPGFAAEHNITTGTKATW